MKLLMLVPLLALTCILTAACSTTPSSPTTAAERQRNDTVGHIADRMASKMDNR